MRCQNPFAFRPGQVSFWTTVIYLAVVIPLIYVHETVPPAPSDHSLYRGLNLTEAWLDLQTISSAYHPYNSHQNDIVRQFIIDRSKQILDHNGADYAMELLGGNVEQDSPASDLQNHITPRSRSLAETSLITLFDDQMANVTWTYDTRGVISANVGPKDLTGQYFEGNNYYVYIRGTDDPEGDWWKSESDYKITHGTGGVLVSCHFDSVATAYGATDDGMSCVTMLQLLSYFTSENRQPRNGIVLLFNNAEEDGLFGAYAFGNSPLVRFCHTFVNLEGAGAGGRAMLFRATDLESAEAYSGSPYPFGSIVAADSFKLGVVRSNTDYTVFHDYLGQRGLDIAFYEPRARYHTEDDDARHASVNSIWHMLSAALASTEKLAQTTGTTFHGDRSDSKVDLVQNGKPTDGVWFDLFGRAWATFALRGLFAWSLCLLVATPLILFVITYVLIRLDKYYFFARDIKIHSEINDDPVKLGGWRGFFRFPLALIFASAMTMASVLLLAKFNPLIVYSSGYAVWAMTLSLFYFSLWLVMRGSSFVRPSALHRGYVNIWLFILGWAIQVIAAVAEDRMHLGALYSTAFLHTVVFLSLLISLCELFALPKKHDYALMLHDAHQARDNEAHDEDHSGFGGDAGQDEIDDAEDDDEGEESADPTETTPLVAGQQNDGGNSTSFANTYRRSVSADSPQKKKGRTYPAYDHEQSWSGRLPSWTWFIQLLLLAPVPVILIGNMGLTMMTSLGMTGTDGGSLPLPLLAAGILSIILLLPLSPFIHRVTHHVPLFLLLVFLGTFIYNMIAFPFSANNRFKVFFQQVLDLDDGTNVVNLAGIEEYVRDVIDALPEAAEQQIKCSPVADRDLMSCQYDASSQPPNLVPGENVEDLITVSTSMTADGQSANIHLDALDTRTCFLDVSQPVYAFSVDGGGARDPRFGALPADGFQHIQVWRREWTGPWNITLQMKEAGKSAESENQASEDGSKPLGDSELKSRVEPKSLRADNQTSAAPFNVTVRCAWSDANEPSTIPAFYELKKYMPTWAVASKIAVGLVEVRKTYSVSA